MRMALLVLATLAALTTRAAAESKTAPRKGPYEVKSGTIEMTNSMIEGSTTTIYFDDYGVRRATLTSMHSMVMDQPINTERWQIVADGAITNYDAMKKTGTRRKIVGDRIPPPAGMSSLPDPRTISDQARKSMKNLGEKQVAGKTCKGIEMNAMGMSVRAWTWKGIPLYTEVGSGASSKDPKAASAKPIVIQATSFKEGDVPASRFTVPADVVIKDF
jgi:hypothetical protein